MINSGNGDQWQSTSVPYGGGRLTIISGFVGPYGLARDVDDRLYVPDLKEGRVLRFTARLAFDGWLGVPANDPGSVSGWHDTGKPLRGSDSGMFDMAHSVAFDAAGDVYIADYANGRIQRYGPDGEYRGLFFSPPVRPELAFVGCANAAFDAEYNLWISDFGAHRIFKFASGGSLVGWLGEFASGAVTNGFADSGRARRSSACGGFDKPHMVRVDGQGNMYVVETGNHRVQKFTAGGRFLGWIGARTNGEPTSGWATSGKSAASDQPGGFFAPVSLQLVDDECMIIADNGNHRIQKFTLDGRFVGWLGALSSGGVTSGWADSGESVESDLPGGFAAPFDARLYGDTLYVADGHNGRVQIFVLDNP